MTYPVGLTVYLVFEALTKAVVFASVGLNHVSGVTSVVALA
jgi:hypothetical protein